MEEEARFAFNFVPVEQAVSAALQSLHTYTYSPHFRTGLAYHAAMLQHAHPLEPHPECPERLEAVMLGLARSGLYDRMYKLDIVPVQEKEWMLVHTKEYMNSLLHLIKQYAFGSLCSQSKTNNNKKTTTEEVKNKSWMSIVSFSRLRRWMQS